MREAENIISTSIERTIRNKLPVRYILKEYLGNDYKSDDEDDNITEDDVKLAITNKQKNNILKLVKKELENMNGEINVNNESSIRKLIQDELQKISKNQEDSNKKSKRQETTAEDVIEEIVEKVVAEALEIKEEPTVEIKEEPTREIKEPTVEIKEEREEKNIDTNYDTEEIITDNLEETIQVKTLNEAELSKEILLENKETVRLENKNPKLEISELPEVDNDLDNETDNETDNDLDNNSDFETKSEPDKFQVHSLDDIDFGTDFDTDDDLESVDFEKQKNEVSKKSEFSFY